VLTVRAVATADAARLREVRLRALAESPDAFAAALEEESKLPRSYWAELAMQSEDGDHAAIYLALDGSRTVGLAAGRWFDRERGVVQLWGMWVDPSARGLRVGEQLVSAVRDWAAGRGARFVRLGVITREGDATAFYERLGFVRTGEVIPLRRDPTQPAHFLARPV
jgi:GNAT superfamily N-acetyltransferase